MTPAGECLPEHHRLQMSSAASIHTAAWPLQSSSSSSAAAAAAAAVNLNTGYRLARLRTQQQRLAILGTTDRPLDMLTTDPLT